MDQEVEHLGAEHLKVFDAKTVKRLDDKMDAEARRISDVYTVVPFMRRQVSELP